MSNSYAQWNETEIPTKIVFFFHFIFFHCSIRWIVKILKNQKLKCLVFINNNRILVKLLQRKKAKITISFFMKNSKNNSIILGFKGK